VAVELSAGNVWVGTLTRNGPGVARTRALGTDRRPKDRDLAYQLQTIADSEDWRLYRGTTLGAATLVKARLYPKGCTWDAPATTPTFAKGGRTRIGARGPWHTERRGWRWDETRTGEDPRRIAAGRDSTGRGPTSHQLWHGRDSDGIPMPANPGTSRRWPATAGLADPGRLMTPIPTSGRNIWERPGMSRHRGPSPVSREQRLMAAGWTAPDGGPGGVSAWLPESTRDSGRMPAGRDGPDAVTRRRNSGSPRLGVRWRSGVR
jgi:hypothetical protein